MPQKQESKAQEFTLRGYQAPLASPSALQSDRVKVKAEFRPGSFRSGTERQAEVPVADDELVEVEFEDGLRVWLTGKEYREKLEKEGKRAPGATGALEVPDTLAFGGAGAGERGIVGWVLKSLKIVGVDLPAKSAVRLAGVFEEKKEGEKRPGPGFYRCQMLTGQFALKAPPAEIKAERLLVFIHGTASSTWGSFGELWSAARSGTLAGLKGIYGENAFALDHRSMTVSPIANALELARELGKRVKDGARIDLVSHSRGGLVGELVCRMNVAGGGAPFEGIDAQLVADARWLASDDDLDKEDLQKAKEALAASAVELKALGDELAKLAKRGVVVRRFVRVACPTLGTSLVSRRLDRWVQILANVGAFAAKTTPIGELVDSLGDFITAVLHEKTKPQELPGIAAMLPEAGFISMVNNPTRTIGSQLAVIAGDIEPEGIWQRLLTLIADKFYAGEHDLVVNTGSMYGGAPREPGAALLSYHAGSAVNHFNYFKNEASAEAIVAALGRTDFVSLPATATGFESLRKPSKPIAREVMRGPAGPRPIVFVLPGIMGSELSVENERVWMNVPSLFLGGLARLYIGVEKVTALRPYEPYYGALIEYLADTHKVIPFPYDWRLPPEVEADRLAQDVQRAVRDARAAGKPVRIVAHSMGGLIARTMIKRHPEVWNEMASVAGARFIMLGTPNGGSHSINALVVGQSSTLRKLALLDVKHSNAELLAIISRFPGVLSLLPGAKDGDDDYLDPKTWKRYFEAGGDGWVLPDAQDLARTREFRNQLETSPIDAKKMVYVAGQSRSTLVRMLIDESAKGSDRIRFRATPRGDGEVPWDTGIPAGLKAYFMPGVVHGNLPSAEEHFPAILELLERGETSRLRQEEPVSREAAVEFDVVREPVENLPDERALAAAALGGAPPQPRRRAERGTRIRVSVMHGHLKFADHPVLVGHYKGDTIISAERVLDSELDGRLTQRHRLGLYPDNVETCEIVLRRRRDAPERWRGAVVVGLGPVGELGVGNLVATAAHGALHYAVKLSERSAEEGEQETQGEIQEIGLSALLVGTNAGGVRSRDSVLAVLEAVNRANVALEAQKRPARITSLQFVELLQSKALQAVEDVQFVAEQTRLKGVVVAPARLDRRRGARSQLVFQEQEGWWQRMQIKGKAPEGQPGDGALRFVSLTGRARAEARVIATQRKLVDQFVRNSIRETRTDPELPRTLFELLLPNEIKEQAPDRSNLVLVLDEESARYPWELLENRWDGSGLPLALNRGLLRQLEVPLFRENPIRSLGRAALVVGDPMLDEKGPLKPLPGARAEAEAVADVLERSGRFEVTRRIQSSAGEIVRGLFAQSFRVIHLAGHGVYEWKPPVKQPDCDACGQPLPEGQGGRRKEVSQPVTGMVLGNDVFLTPGEVEQMRRVPELVFINCCHLGYTEDRERRAREEAAEGKPRTPAPLNDYHLFAANVSTQFIRQGVRAVIAAGWAVDDAAGKTFATAFYDAMLRGEPFGDAVRWARELTGKRHPYANTWGAYQCYGDPDFRLDNLPREEAGGEPRFASVEQLINRADNLASDVESLGGESLGPPLKALDGLRKVLAEDETWRRNGRAWAALARAYNCAFQFDAAVECYYEALGCEDGGLSIGDLEQLSNCESSLAVALWRAGVADVTIDDLRKSIDASIERLQSLVRLPRAGKAAQAGKFAETRERLVLLASAYKRKAWIAEGPAQRIAALETMRDCYKRAAELQGASGDAAYPILNWAAATLVLDWLGQKAAADVAKSLEDSIAQVRQRLEEQIRARRELWDSASLADLKLMVALREGKLDGKSVVELAKDYIEVRRLASAREYESVREQIDFLAAMAKATSAAAGELEDLVAKLSGPSAAAPSEDGEPEGEAEEAPAEVRAPRAGARGARRGARTMKGQKKQR